MSGSGLRVRARRAVADRDLARALAGATDHLASKRAQVIDGLDNWEQLRHSARAVRERTIAHLPEVLARLADRVEAAGGQVFFAADAVEACAYVVEVARRRGAQRLVKAKSMISEEIGLNRALEAAGLEVVETDLGEWIMQLAGEPPSHIVAPALHLSRSQIGGILSRHAGEELSDDPAALTAFARRRLREVFLSAEVGITGCNFAVAETGTVCLVTNEGNGRMVTSLPSVHIAIMGMERVVETWEDLDLMLSLLPRSATGQALTAYTTMITGPRRSGEVDGPDEFHLVILDGGRSGILGGPYRAALSCIRCGACLNVCPVYRQIGGHAYAATYSGPIGSVISPLLFGGEACELRLASSLCGACYQVCPVMIPLQDLLLSLRRDAAATANRSERWLWRGWARMWSSPRWYRLTIRLAGVGARFIPGRLVPRWGTGRDVPRPGRDAGS
jgi:L-lactate dehydrogenase complex protein LldF